MLLATGLGITGPQGTTAPPPQAISVTQSPLLLRVGVPVPPLLDLRDAQAALLVPEDPRIPAQVEAVRTAWLPLIAPFQEAVSLRLRLPLGPGRVALLLAASQALKAQKLQRTLYLEFDPLAPAILDEGAWGAVDGGVLLPEALGPNPALWRQQLGNAQSFFPGRPWTLWLPADPGPLLGTLMGDGGRIVIPPGGPAATLSLALPPGYSEVEGGLGDITLRTRAGAALRWRFELGAWQKADLPKSRVEVAVTGAQTYDVSALLATMRAAQLRDRAAFRTFEADLAVDLHLQSSRGPGVDLGFRFRTFEALGDSEELLQRQVLVNGVNAKLPDGVQLPIVESRTSLAQPVALSLTERYRYADAGPAGPGVRLLRFEPVDPNPTLLRGQLKVEEATGRILEETSEREGLPGTVKSERRLITYGAVGSSWRPLRTQTFERWLSPGGITQVQRTLTYTAPGVNAEGFETRRAQARQGTGTMLKQTQDGVRYFVPQPDGTRRIEERPRTSGRGVGLFLLMDPGLGWPVVPLGGFGYSDFNAFDKGVQLNALIAGVFNSVALAVPSLPGGFDLNLNASTMLLSTDQRPVKGGRLLGKDSVGRRFGTLSLEAGHDLGRGFRAELQGRFQYDRYGLARDYRTEGYVLPPDGWTQELRGELSWLWRGFQARGFYGKGERPDGLFGAPGAIQPVADHGAFRRWGGTLSLDRQLRPDLWFHGEASAITGRGFDRFQALYVGGLIDGSVAGIRTNALAADRITSAKASLTLPSGANLRLSLGLEHAQARSLDDGRNYRFSGVSAVGDLPGFWWVTTCRVNLGVGLQSDVPGVKVVNGMISFFRVF